MNPVIQFHT
jgi:hypothetical protein